MKKRILSALALIIILIPFILIGGNVYKSGVIALSIIAFYELIKAKDNKKKIPLLMILLSLGFYLFQLIYFLNSNLFDISINIKYLTLFILLLLFSMCLYGDNKKFNIEDVSYLVFTNLFLLIGFNLLMNVRDYNINYFIMVLLIATTSDTFAYFTGLLIGKHKLCPNVSPKKTIEGLIGGLIFCLTICVPIYISLFNYTGNIFVLILIVLALSLTSTLGDLIFSSIKRHFDIKDYSNLIPGHGGVMDRLDSFLVVLIMFYILISYIGG